MSNPLFDLLKKTQNKDSTPLNEQSRVGKTTLQWFLEKDVKTHPIHNNNELEFLICSEGFAALEQDIRQASSTIDLVCWGFDPAMELTRDSGEYWPRGKTYGQLLADKAAQGVKVRLLLWYDSVYLDAIKGSPLAALSMPAYLLKLAWNAAGNVINTAAANAPDMPAVWAPVSALAGAVQQLTSAQAGQSLADNAQERTGYAQAWWKAALAGGIQNLEVRFRQGQPLDVVGLKKQYLPDARDWIEDLGLVLAATHHQKQVLIDYHPGQGEDPSVAPNTCGYVMGLNSVTDYWDTPEHEYNDPRREIAFDNTADPQQPWHRKPFRDYAMRIQGQALACLNRNFVTPWDRAQNTHLSLSSSPSLQSARADIEPPAQGGCRAQIVRTQPEDRDATILKTYVQACSNACNYIYIENQYFQLTEWVQFIKQVRQGTLDMLRKAGGSKEKLPPLHLMVISPQAERNEMVPRTHDALAQMGQATSVQGYHQQVQDMQEGKDVKDALGQTLAPSDARLAMLQQSAQISQSDVQRDLDSLNIKTLAGMLMSYDREGQSAQIKIKTRDNNAQEWQAELERAQAQQEGRTQGYAKDDVAGKKETFRSRPGRYREIYIHSKLMLIDDSFITLGSANLNVRSMTVDSEINIASAEQAVASSARQRVWANLAGDDLDGGNGSLATVGKHFDDWADRMQKNAQKRDDGDQAQAPINDSFIHTHHDPRDAPLLRLA